MADSPKEQIQALLRLAGHDAGVNANLYRAIALTAVEPVLRVIKMVADFRVTTETSRRDVTSFHRKTMILAFWMVASMLWRSAIDYHQKRLELDWRAAITRRLHEKYLVGIRFYEAMYHKAKELQVVDADVRIAEDVPTVTKFLAKLVAGSHISGTSGCVPAFMSFIMGLVGLLGKGAFTVIASSFCLIGGGVIVPQMLPSVSPAEANGPMLSAWSTLRERITRMQANDEQICALQGGPAEQQLLDAALEEVVTTTTNRNRILQVSEGAQYLMLGIGLPGQNARAPCCTIAGTLFLCAPYWSEMYRHRIAGGNLPPIMAVEEAKANMAERFTVAIEYMGYGAMMVNGLFGMVQHLIELQTVTAQLRRVLDLFKALEQLEVDSSQRQSTSYRPCGDAIRFEGVDIRTPTDVQLVKSLSFEVGLHESLLVTGHNGAGKSSIFRVLSGLWSAAAGVVCRPLSGSESGLCSSVLYLPQKPYSPVGTLCDLFFYPNPPPAHGAEAEMRRWLSYVDLADLVDRPGALAGEHDWELELSLGELQRISAVRLFYQQPQFAVLDECTSAVSVKIEKRIFELCQVLGISRMTIAHRPMMQEFHNKMLTLTGKSEDPDGGWRLQNMEPRVKAVRGSGKLDLEARHLAVEKYLQDRGDRASDVLAPNGNEAPPPASKPDRKLAAALSAGGSKDATSLRVQAQSIYKALNLGLASVPDFGQRGALVLLLCALRTAFNVYNFTTGLTDLMGACLTFNRPAVARYFLRSAMGGILLTWLDCSIVRSIQGLQIDCWRGLGKHLHQAFFSGDAFYKVRNRRPVLLAEPAQQLLESKQFVEDAFKHVEDTLKPLMTISVGSTLIIRSVGFLGGIALVSTVAVGRLVTKALMPNFAEHQNSQAELDVKFKTVHARLKQHAEAVAFSGGAKVEGAYIEGRFAKLIEHQETSLGEEVWYTFSKMLLTESDGVPLMMLKYLGMSFVTSRFGAMSEDGATSAANLQANFNLDRIIANITFPFLSIIGTVPENLARLGASAARILALEEALREAADEAPPESQGTVGDTTTVAVIGANIFPPGGNSVARALDVTIKAGEPLMVTGQNASGKSSLGRVLLGMWGVSEGQVLVCGQLVSSASRPARANLFPVPQRPYLCHGLPLSSQVAYPSDAEVGEEDVRELLSTVGIAYLLDRYQSKDTPPWQDVLSGGEQQRLGVARCLYHRPRFALLDDCTSMVSQEAEVKLYQSVLEMGITPIAMSQRLTLPELFPRELSFTLGAASGWKLCVH